MQNKFLIEAFQTPENVASTLLPYFGELPKDPYVDSDVRFRSYARFSLSDKGDIVRLPHAPFMQSSEVNRVVGDIERHFEPMSDDMIDLPEFHHLLKSFASATGLEHTGANIDVHQIRVTCSANDTSAPAPEGIHQDGFRFVGIFCVQRKNIAGGFTQIFSSPVDQHPHLNTVLEPNQFIILDDQRYYHHISETLSSNRGEEGVRDVFVFTA
ncbi:2OG-Fe dioxygenase family protein [Grimontia sp. S25]|uniref:2OG-Fe dioxygenase family protein n=1 Tax=Grimontia sedimenti TaxID=2711294 RepID=A0A6M1RK72_9GAMM|nr:2OG-Fe dioxygenase family protein [Grimontia sedimenti]NGN99842.1 2OG-Fe dioxygenase family protein [Grimontia sedimenti]